jgi:hypothetical protein
VRDAVTFRIFQPAKNNAPTALAMTVPAAFV